jgi:hypothetical protein
MPETRKPGNRSEANTTLFGDYPYAFYDVRESGTIHAWSENANNPAEAWFQGATGAYSIVNPDGSTTTHKPGESRVEKESITVTITENSDTHIGGHMTMKMKGGMEIEASGDGQVTIGGAAVINILGNGILNVQGNATVASKGTMNLNAAEGMNIRAGGGMTIGATGAISLQAGGGIKMQENGDPGDGYSTTNHAAAAGATSST